MDPTERPITVEEDTDVVFSNSTDWVLAAAHDALEGRVVRGRVPEKWDGNAAERIVEWLVGNA